MHLRNKEALIVDDIESVRMLLRKFLEQLGMIVHEAESAPRAIEFLHKKKVDVIFLDLEMPEMSGFDFLAVRKEKAFLSGTPVIVLSGVKEDVAIAKAITLGANDYILKPMNVQIISCRLMKLLTPHFQWYRFPSNKTPILMMKTQDPFSSIARQVKIQGKIIEVDEVGMLVLCNTLIPDQSFIEVTGDGVKEMTGKTKSFGVLSISIRIALQEGTYSIYLEFPPQDEALLKTVKSWIESRPQRTRF